VEFALGLLLGIILGIVGAYFILKKDTLNKTVKNYELKIRNLEDEYHQKLKDSKDRSLDGSRAVIKGKIAEQFAPLLPGFSYLPSDARFIGDPIDYIVFKGYTELKDKKGRIDDLEIVLIDVKTGKASLSALQEAIAKAVKDKRVRFEVVRPNISDTENYQLQTEDKDSDKSYSVSEIRNNSPNAYKGWTPQEDVQLVELYKKGKSIEELASEFGRQTGGITSRLRKLGEIE